MFDMARSDYLRLKRARLRLGGATGQANVSSSPRTKPTVPADRQTADATQKAQRAMVPSRFRDVTASLYR